MRPWQTGPAAVRALVVPGDELAVDLEHADLGAVARHDPAVAVLELVRGPPDRTWASPGRSSACRFIGSEYGPAAIRQCLCRRVPCMAVLPGWKQELLREDVRGRASSAWRGARPRRKAPLARLTSLQVAVRRSVWPNQPCPFRASQSALSLSRSTLPRSDFGSSGTISTCLGSLAAARCCLQCATTSASVSVTPGLAMT